MRHKKRYLFALFWILLLTYMSATLLYHSQIYSEDGRRSYRIGAVYMTMNNPYFEVINEEMKAVIKNKGDVLITRDSVLDSETQNHQIEELIEEDIDVLLVNAVDWKKISPELKKAKKAGIKIIAVDTEVYDEDLVDSIVVSDNYTVGVLCARHLMQKRQSAKILLLVQSDNKSARDRIKGFIDTLDKANWKYEVVEKLECKGQLEVAQPLVEEILNRKNFDVVMALNDPSALGAMSALEAKGVLDHVDVYGVDGAPEAKNMIKEGKMTATIAQSPLKAGAVTTEVMYDILSGKTVEKKHIIPVTVITSSNIDEYSLTGWQ